jgi:hypothetical protein
MYIFLRQERSASARQLSRRKKAWEMPAGANVLLAAVIIPAAYLRFFVCVVWRLFYCRWQH